MTPYEANELMKRMRKGNMSDMQERKNGANW